MNRLYWQSTFGTLFISTGDLRWSVIDQEEIFVFDHKTRAGLQLADIGAGAFFQALEKNRSRVVDCDPTYAKMLVRLMARDNRLRILNYGFKTMPRPREMGLAFDQREIFEFYGYPKEKW